MSLRLKCMNEFALNSADCRVELFCSDYFSVSMVSHEDAVSVATGGGVGGLGEAQWDPVPEWGQHLATMSAQRVVY